TSSTDSNSSTDSSSSSGSSSSTSSSSSDTTLRNNENGNGQHNPSSPVITPGQSRPIFMTANRTAGTGGGNTGNISGGTGGGGFSFSLSTSPFSRSIGKLSTSLPSTPNYLNTR